MKKQLINSLRAEGFSEKIVNTFEKVERERFIPERYRTYAYRDMPLPIGHGQTISQPFTIAFMLELLNLHDNLSILEIGSGSGYVLALINEISKNSRIYGVERIKELVDESKRNINGRVLISHCDGTNGFQRYAPYDRILVSAAFSEIPSSLVSQLRNNGILVAPVGNSIIKITKNEKEGKEKIEEFPGFAFVPVIPGVE